MKTLKLTGLLCFVLASSMWAKVPVRGNSTYGIFETPEGTQPFGSEISEFTFCATTPDTDPCPNTNNMYIFEYLINSQIDSLTLTATAPIDSDLNRAPGFGIYECEDTSSTPPVPCSDPSFNSDFQPGLPGSPDEFTAGNVFQQDKTITFSFAPGFNNVGLVLYVAEDSASLPSTPTPCIDCAVPTATPEPGSFVLLGSGLVAVAWLGRRRFASNIQRQN